MPGSEDFEVANRGYPFFDFNVGLAIDFSPGKSLYWEVQNSSRIRNLLFKVRIIVPWYQQGTSAALMTESCRNKMDIELCCVSSSTLTC